VCLIPQVWELEGEDTYCVMDLVMIAKLRSLFPPLSHFLSVSPSGEVVAMAIWLCHLCGLMVHCDSHGRWGWTW
jgi:hypothetical protein